MLGEAGDSRVGGGEGSVRGPGESSPATLLRRLLRELQGFVPAEPLHSICRPAAEAGLGQLLEMMQPSPVLASTPQASCRVPPVVTMALDAAVGESARCQGHRDFLSKGLL